MSQTRHTAEPWEVNAYAERKFSRRKIYGIVGAKDEEVITPWTDDDGSEVGGIETEANASRIVACVNACEGIDDPAIIPAILRTVQEFVQHYHGPKAGMLGNGFAKGSARKTHADLMAYLIRAQGRVKL